MKHLLLKAATTATDQGTFEAVISTGSVDREGDIVEPSAFITALEKWITVGKLVPLDYNHSGEVIGHIDPATARVEGNEVIAKGFIDQSIPRGEESWRLVKSGTLSFSFGFLVPDGGATKRAGKKSGYHITELDLFEISVVPVAPANNDTRVLSYKALRWRKQTGTDAPPTTQQVRILNSMIGQAQEYIASGPDPEDGGEMAGVLEVLEELLGEPGTEDEVDGVETDKNLSQHTTHETVDETDKDASRSVDPLRKQAESTALEFASDGLSLQRPPKQVVVQKPEPELSLADLKRRMRDEVLIHLSGEEI